MVSPNLVSFNLNGSEVSVSDQHPHLLAALREELAVCSPKDGCSPSGQCGCCTVLVDGKAIVSCNLSLQKVAGANVTTLEGLPAEDRDRMASAFAATGALQCGFCTPGILVRVASLLEKKGSDLDRDTAARHLGAHLCRCTGYVKILDAVELLAKGETLALEPLGGVGTSGSRYQGFELALGEKPYIDDMRPAGLLHGAVRLADHARADVLRIDTTAAAAVPGVVRVLTAADVPGTLRVGLIHKDWPVFIPAGGRTSYLGDVLAFVVANDRATARRAAELVEVEYRVLRTLADPVAALDDDEDAVWELDGNVLSRSAYERGDTDAALAASAHVVHDVFQTQRIEHAFLEPESTLVVPEADGKFTMFTGGQGVWDDRDQVASVLDIDPQRITAVLVSNGGAFGGKEDMANQAQTALAALLLDAPVKCTLSREESLLIHPKRHPIRIDLTVGCDADGKLTALWARMIGDSGPYASVGMKVLERAAGHASGPYQLPAIDVEAFAVRTNNSVCGAFRGFGANQAQFAMEGALDRLAQQVGISGWEIRNRNVIKPGEVWGPGQVMDDGCRGAQRCLEAIKPAYDTATASGRAVGLGLGLKNSGLGNGFLEIVRAVVRFADDGTVEVRHCWTEMGQGVHTVAAQVAIEELGVAPERVRVIVDTTRELGAGQTTGSRGTLMGAGAVADACRAAREDGCRPGVDYEGEYRVDWTSSIAAGVEHPVIHSAFGYAAQLVVIDRETGNVERVVAAHDVGRAVNPLQCVGQIEGAVHMGLGYALTEDFPCDDDGRPTLNTLRGLGIIRAKDVPPIEVILVEEPQPRAPYGIKGVGEIGLVPTAGAVAAALHDLDGEWRTSLPMRRGAMNGAPGEATTTGLVCAHTHLYSALARGMPAPPRTPRTFPEILELVWWRVDRALDLEMLRWGAMLGALEALEAGTTAIIDHHSSPSAPEGSLDVIAQACAEVGVRVLCCYEVTDRNGADGAKAGLAENERFLRGGGRGLVGAHASFTLSDETLDAVCGLASDLGVGVHVHVAEDPVDVAAGARLAARADERWILAHAVHLDRALPGTVVHNPRSNLNNAVGYGRPVRFDRVALGTDGIGADMLEEFRLAFALARADDVTAAPELAWSWLQTGVDLVPEVRDDTVTWSYAPMDPWHLAYTPGVRALRVEVAGETVLDANGPTRVDAPEIRARAAEQAVRLHQRLEEL